MKSGYFGLYTSFESSEIFLDGPLTIDHIIERCVH